MPRGALARSPPAAARKTGAPGLQGPFGTAPKDARCEVRRRRMEKTSVASALRPGLRGYFDVVLNEPLPEALADLAGRLPTSEQPSKRAQGTPQEAERQRCRDR
jgi:hypothetical protein